MGDLSDLVLKPTMYWCHTCGKRFRDDQIEEYDKVYWSGRTIWIHRVLLYDGSTDICGPLLLAEDQSDPDG